MTQSPAPPLRLTSMGQLPEVAPYLVGFTPEESIVLMVTDNGAVAVTARIDLADATQAGGIEHVLDTIDARFPGNTVHSLAYTSNAKEGWDVLRRIDAHATPGDAGLSLLVAGDTWYSAAGATGAINRHGAATAAAVYAGLRANRSRSDLTDVIQRAPDSPELTRAVHDMTVEVTARYGPRMGRIHLMHDLVSEHVSNGMQLPTNDSIRLAIAASEPSAQHLAAAMIGHPHDADKHQQMWLDVVHQVPDPLAAQPLYLVALSSWINGNGALTNLAVEEARTITGHRDNDLDKLLSGLNHRIVPPTRWPEFRQALVEAAHPRVGALADIEAPQHPTTGETWETITPPTQSRRHPGVTTPPTQAPRI